MKKSKKGITLVELVICCAIIVMLGGACTAVLASGSRVFNQSTSAATSQMDADVLQNHMMNMIPSAKNVGQINMDKLKEAKILTTGSYMFFDPDNNGVFTIRVNGTNYTIRSIKEFEYSIVQAGAATSTTARAQFVYKASMSDGTVLNGGFVLSNVKYVEEEMSQITGVVSENPFCFNLPPESTETTDPTTP